MPKRVGNIFGEVACDGNARAAITNASRGKRERPTVKHALNEIERHSAELVSLVGERRYAPSPSINVMILDGPHKKVRKIAIPKFWPDQCVHWMVMQVVQPLIVKGMYEHNCGSIPGRGSKAALDYVQKALETDPQHCAWCLKLDVEKYYEHINHDLLKQKFRRIIKDPDVLRLLDLIIDSYEIGVPIGYYTSQWFANFYLQDIDHRIKEQLHVPHYVRYMDDMLLMGSNKRELLRAKKIIENWFAEIGLKIRTNVENPSKKNWEIFRPREVGIEFIGTRFVPEKVSETAHLYCWHREMNKQTMLRMTRTFRKIALKGYLSYEDACAVVSYYGIARSGNNWQFEKKWLRPFVSFERAKEVVSIESRKPRTIKKKLRSQRRWSVARCDGEYTAGNHV